jgi:hypothetical protein
MKNIQGGNLTTNSKSKRANSGLKFKEASVTGNPVAYAMGQAKYLCNSKIKPYMPYYLSTLDEKMWRSGLSDMLYLSTWVILDRYSLFCFYCLWLNSHLEYFS